MKIRPNSHKEFPYIRHCAKNFANVILLNTQNNPRRWCRQYYLPFCKGGDGPWKA